MFYNKNLEVFYNVKNFLKALGMGAFTIALNALPTVPAFAKEGENIIEVADVISELNSWYKANNIPFSLESANVDDAFSLSDLSKDLQALQSLQVCSKSVIESDDTDTSLASMMLVSYSHTTDHKLSVSLFEDGTMGVVHLQHIKFERIK